MSKLVCASETANETAVRWAIPRKVALQLPPIELYARSNWSVRSHWSQIVFKQSRFNWFGAMCQCAVRVALRATEKRGPLRLPHQNHIKWIFCAPGKSARCLVSKQVLDQECAWTSAVRGGPQSLGDLVEKFWFHHFRTRWPIAELDHVFLWELKWTAFSWIKPYKDIQKFNWNW